MHVRLRVRRGHAEASIVEAHPLVDVLRRVRAVLVVLSKLEAATAGRTLRLGRRALPWL